MNTSNAVLALTEQLIARPSITPQDEGCQEIMTQRLAALGFDIKQLTFGEVSNFWAIHGESGPLLVFAGHTDVVPSGPSDQWLTPPFEPTVSGDLLFGRGAADMKGSLAAMLIAAERFVGAHPQHKGQLAFLITSDEEGAAINGTAKVMEYLNSINQQIDWCVVGEPSSTNQLGDVVKNGRRGSLGGRLIIHGVQGHIAYPDQACNPIHLALPALNELTCTDWDQGNRFFPATSLQISNIQAGTGATNMIPGQLELLFNFRYSTEVTAEQLMATTEALLHRHSLTFTLDWTHSGKPFLTEPGELLDAVSGAVLEVTGHKPLFSTGGGTSDGRFIAPHGAQVVELGPCNDTIHKVNECVSITALEQLTDIYQLLITRLLQTA